MCQQCRTPLPSVGPTGRKKRRDVLYCDSCNKERQKARELSWNERNIDCLRVSKAKYQRKYRERMRNGNEAGRIQPDENQEHA